MKIRRGFVRIAQQRIRQGDMTWVWRQARQYWRIRRALRRRDGRTLCGPVIVHFFCTRRCNLRCPMCDIPDWDATEELDTKQALEVIDQAAALGAAGISFTGGEPLLRPDIFDLLVHARRRGLETILVTNGLRLAALAEAVVAAGPGTVNVSMDGADPWTHDQSRGVAGAFDRTTAGVRALTAEIRRQGAGTRIVASTVLSGSNVDQLDAVLRTCLDLGMDRVIFCPLHEFSGDGSRVAPIDTGGDVRGHLMRHPRRRHIDNSDRYLSHLNRVLTGHPPPAGCVAGYTTLVVDFAGFLYPCKCRFENRRALAGPLAPGVTLASAWHGDAFNAFRRTCRACRGCYLTINREFDGLFG